MFEALLIPHFHRCWCAGSRGLGSQAGSCIVTPIPADVGDRPVSFGMVGIARAQTARLNLVNIGGQPLRARICGASHGTPPCKRGGSASVASSGLASGLTLTVDGAKMEE